MRIRELRLDHFRGFNSLLLEFQDDLNVLVGENGTGKSSVLDAISILLSWLPARLRSSSGTGRQLGDDDITLGASHTVVALRVSTLDSNAQWQITKALKGRKKTVESDLSQATELAKELQARAESNGDGASLPVLAYYPVNRAVLDIPFRIRTRHSFAQPIAAYDESLVGGADFRRFFEWFKEREDIENENYRMRLFDPSTVIDPQLQAVREAIHSITMFEDLRVRRQPLRMELRKGKQVLKVNQLSDGEKCLLALVGDLARRLAIANPGTGSPLKGNGVILIDEVELHLHPSWQRMVIPRLRTTFPNCQFIISTHSPQVISHVEAEKLFLFRQAESGIETSRAGEAYGKSSDRILEDLMGVPARPVEIRDRLREIFSAIDRNELDQAREMIKMIQGEIGDDPELVKAGVMIVRKESIGR